MFLSVEVYHCRLVEVADEKFPKQTQAIQQVAFLHFAPDGSHFRGNRSYRFYVSRYRRAHHFLKQRKEVFVIVGRLNDAGGFQETAVGNVRHRLGVFLLQTVNRPDGINHFIVLNSADIQRLATRLNGGQHVFQVFRHKQKDGVLGRFFNHFQQLVGAGIVHFFGQPHDHYFIGSFVNLQVQFADDFVAFFRVNNALRVFGVDEIEPVVEVEIGVSV